MRQEHKSWIGTHHHICIPNFSGSTGEIFSLVPPPTFRHRLYWTPTPDTSVFKRGKPPLLVIPYGMPLPCMCLMGPQSWKALVFSFHCPPPGSTPWTIHPIFPPIILLSIPFPLPGTSDLPLEDSHQCPPIQLPVLTISGDVVFLKLVTSLTGLFFILLFSLFLHFIIYMLLHLRRCVEDTSSNVYLHLFVLNINLSSLPSCL